MNEARAHEPNERTDKTDCSTPVNDIFTITALVAGTAMNIGLGRDSNDESKAKPSGNNKAKVKRGPHSHDPQRAVETKSLNQAINHSIDKKSSRKPSADRMGFNIEDKTLVYPTPHLKTGERISNEQILKPDASKLNCRCIRLDNGLTAFLINDPEAELGAAALNVEVGSFHNHDPDSKEMVKGLAHFLEHMLFMGTEKYPNEAEYNEYINENGGHSNAFTASDCTNYHFCVVPTALEGGLDRFAQFFIAPLFDESCVEREMKAVESEQQKNLQSNAHQKYLLTRKLNCPEGHPVGHFNAGDMTSLLVEPKAAGIDVIQKMKSFHKKYYSANVMSLCIVSNHSLDELEKMAVENFSTIVNNNVKIPRDRDFNQAPYTPTETGLAVCEKAFNKTMILQVPSADTRKIIFHWHIPADPENWASKASNYATHIIGHEGENSLLSALKKEHLVLSLSAGGGQSFAGSMLMNVTMTLPNEDPWDFNKIERIGEMLFATIRLLQEEEINNAIVEETLMLSELQFRSEQLSKDMNLAVEVAYGLPSRVRPEMIFASELCHRRRDDLFKREIDSLTDENYQLYIMSPDVKNFGYELETEQYNKTLYTKVPIDEKLTKKWSDTLHGKGKTAKDFGIGLPTLNPFVPKDLSVRPSGEHDYFRDLKTQLQVKGCSPRLGLFFKQDDLFRVPKGHAILYIRSGAMYEKMKTDLEFIALIKVMFSCLKEANNEELYDADLAGYRLNYDSSSLCISASGFSDRLGLLTEQMIQSALEPMSIIKEGHFNTVVAHLISKSETLIQSMDPYSLCTQMINNSLLSPSYGFWDYLPHIKSMTFEGFSSWASTFREKLGDYGVDIVLGGNYTEEEGLTFAAMVDKAFNLPKEPIATKPWSYDSFSYGEDLVMESFCGSWAQTNSCVGYFVPLPLPFGLRQSSYLRILVTYMSQPFFDSLRTQQQLGYIVMATQGIYHEVSGLSLWVQSAVADPKEVCQRMDKFLNETCTVDGLTTEKFEKLRTSQIQTLMKKPKDLGTETALAGREVYIDRYIFDLKTKLINFYETEASLDDFMNWAREYLSTPKITSIAHGLSFKGQPEFKSNDEESVVVEGQSATPNVKQLRDTFGGSLVCPKDTDMSSFLLASEHPDKEELQKHLKTEMERVNSYPSVANLRKKVVRYSIGSTERVVENLQK